MNCGRTFVTATAELGSDVTALRIPLFIDFPQPRYPARKRIGDVLKGARQFLALSHATLPPAPKGRIVFGFAHRTPSNMNNLLPVVKEALSRGLVGGIVTNGDFSKELHEFAGTVPVISVRQLVAQLGIRERVRNMARVASTYRRMSTALSLRSRALALCLAGHRESLLRALVDSVVLGCIFGRLLDSWSPACVVSTSDLWPLEHQLCCQASRRQITSVVIQHGTIGDNWWPFVADIYCLWGEASVDEMRRLGAPEERLAALGMPATDEMFRCSPARAHRAVRNPASHPVCLILSHTNGSRYEPEVYDSYREFLARAVNSMPFISWKVKLHPVEDDSFYRHMGSSILERLIFHPRQMSLQEAVADADVATTIYSTSGLEAMILDRPLIVAPATPRVCELAPWPASGGGTYASSAEDFRSQFSQLVSDRTCWVRQMEGQRRFLASYFASPGCAAKQMSICWSAVRISNKLFPE